MILKKSYKHAIIVVYLAFSSLPKPKGLGWIKFIFMRRTTHVEFYWNSEVKWCGTAQESKSYHPWRKNSWYPGDESRCITNGAFWNERYQHWCSQGNYSAHAEGNSKVLVAWCYQSGCMQMDSDHYLWTQYRKIRHERTGHASVQPLVYLLMNKIIYNTVKNTESKNYKKSQQNLYLLQNK